MSDPNRQYDCIDANLVSAEDFIRKLEAENTKLRAEVEAEVLAGMMGGDVIELVKADNAKLRGYVQHKRWCETWYPGDVESPDGKTGPCTCGLDDALNTTAEPAGVADCEVPSTDGKPWRWKCGKCGTVHDNTWKFCPTCKAAAPPKAFYDPALGYRPGSVAWNLGDEPQWKPNAAEPPRVCQCVSFPSERTPAGAIRRGPHHQLSCPMYYALEARK